VLSASQERHRVVAISTPLPGDAADTITFLHMGTPVRETLARPLQGAR